MKNGPYILVKAPKEYPGRAYRGSRRYVYEHHLVWWLNTGDTVPEDYVIHHKNEDKHDNSFENLEILSRAEHSFEHAIKVDNIIISCSWCNIEISLRPSVFRTRKKIKDDMYCSRSCGAKAQWSRKSAST